MFYVSPDSIKIALRQIERWMYAAAVDTNAAIALLHANYAVGDLDLLRQMVSDDIVIRETGKNPQVLLAQAIKLQDSAQKRFYAY